MKAPSRNSDDTQVHGRRVHGYETARPDVQALIPRTARRVLDLGCSTGALGAALKARNGAFVCGIECDRGYAWQAQRKLDRVIIANAEECLSLLRPDEPPFDCLVAADVLEHLVDPWTTLAHAVRVLAPGATVVVSLPNILYWPALLRVAWTRSWPRDDEGIFDRTHLRWFTPADGLALMRNTGLHVTVASPTLATAGVRLAVTKLWTHTPFQPFLARQWLFAAIKQ